jgi:hypothetical protein
MNPGDIVRMSSAQEVRRDDDGKARMRLTWKPLAKNEDFVVLCLGTQAHARDFDADERICTVLRSFGWTIEPPKQSTR